MYSLFNHSQPIIISVVALVLFAVYADLRWRKIPNYLTLPAVAAGLLVNFLANGWNGLLFGFGGFMLGMGLLILPFLFGGMGGGDVKLMGALGAFVGCYSVLNIFFYATLVGGAIAIVVALANKNLADTFKRMWLLLKCVFLFRVPMSGAALFKKSIAIPYGVAICAGTFIYLSLGRMI